MLKASCYNIEIAADDGRQFVYNTFSDRLMEVSPEIADCIRQNQLARIGPFFARALYHDGMLVPADVDEPGRAIEAVRRRRNHKDVRLILIPTYACNLRCPYCYEGDIPQAAPRPIRPEAGWVDSVSSIVERMLQEPGCPGCTVGLYGGEPLLAAGQCLTALRRIEGFCKTGKQKFYCTLTTNGSVFNDTVAEVLTHADSVQVTLDGVGNAHDRLRMTARGEGSYERIRRFISACHTIGVPHITIRYHVHDYSYEYLRSSAKELLERHGNGRLKVYFANVEYGCYQQLFSCCIDRPRDDRSGRLRKAYRAFLDAGWDERSVFISNRESHRRINISCGMVGARTFIADHLGRLYFCPVAVKNDTMALGSYAGSKAVYTNNRERLIENWDIPPSCCSCRVFPLCETGCYAKALMTNGDMFIPLCETDRLDRILRAMCARRTGVDVAALTVESPFGHSGKSTRAAAEQGPERAASPESELKDSQYNVRLEWTAGRAGIFNALAGTRVFLPSSLAREEHLGECEVASDFREKMARLQMLVPRSKDERREYEKRAAEGSASECVEVTYLSAVCRLGRDRCGLDAASRWSRRFATDLGTCKLRFCGHESRPLNERKRLYAKLLEGWKSPVTPRTMWMSNCIVDSIDCGELDADAQFYEWNLQREIGHFVLDRICRAVHDLLSRRVYVQIQVVTDGAGALEKRNEDLSHLIDRVGGENQRYLKWSLRLPEKGEPLYFAPDVCLPQTLTRLRRHRSVMERLRRTGVPLEMPMALRQFYGSCPYRHPGAVIIDHRGRSFRCLREIGGLETQGTTPTSAPRPFERCASCGLEPWCSAQCPRRAVSTVDCKTLFRAVALKTQPLGQGAYV